MLNMRVVTYQVFNLFLEMAHFNQGPCDIKQVLEQPEEIVDEVKFLVEACFHFQETDGLKVHGVVSEEIEDQRDVIHCLDEHTSHWAGGMLLKSVSDIDSERKFFTPAEHFSSGTHAALQLR